MQNDAKRFKIFRRIAALSIEQESAITLLLTGASDQTVATRLKLGRATVNRWRLYHPLFITDLLAEVSSDAPLGLPLDVPVTTSAASAAIAPEPGIHRSFENK